MDFHPLHPPNNAGAFPPPAPRTRFLLVAQKISGKENAPRRHSVSKFSGGSATRGLPWPLEHARRVVPKICSLHKRLKGIFLTASKSLNPLRASMSRRLFREAVRLPFRSEAGAVKRWREPASTEALFVPRGQARFWSFEKVLSECPSGRPFFSPVFFGRAKKTGSGAQGADKPPPISAGLHSVQEDKNGILIQTPTFPVESAYRPRAESSNSIWPLRCRPPCRGRERPA
jgi:hypothetical protein